MTRLPDSPLLAPRPRSNKNWTTRQGGPALCSDPVLQELLAGKGIDTQVFDTVLTGAEKQAMLEGLHDFASSWFLDENNSDYTVYRRASIGGAIHDEVMLMFHALFHFLRVLAKCEPGGVSAVYQSNSCRFPLSVTGLLDSLGVPVHSIDADYPYVCYRMMHEYQEVRNYSYVNLRPESEKAKTGLSISRIRIDATAALAWAGSLFSGKRCFVYCQVLRRLVPFYESYLAQEGTGSGLRLIHDSRKVADKDQDPRNALEHMTTAFRLGMRGVQQDCLLLRSTRCTSAQRKAASGLIQRFRGSFATAWERAGYNGPPQAATCVKAAFAAFFESALPKYVRLIDEYYRKFSRGNVAGCLQEMVHPIQAQVMANCGKRSVVVAPNPMLHNQYMTEYVLGKTRGMLKAVATSPYDKTRYIRLGFSADDVVIARDSVLDSFGSRCRPYRTVQDLRWCAVLIIPPFAPQLYAFRHQYATTALGAYLGDVLGVLHAVGCSKATIRQHPGLDAMKLNMPGYTLRDVYRDQFERSGFSAQSSFEVSFSNSRNANLDQDVETCDLAVGAISGTVLDVLMLGRDYVVYDDSIAPHPGHLEGSLVHDGLVKRYRTRQELLDHLQHYKPTNRERLFAECYPGIEPKADPKEGGCADLLSLL